MEEFQSIRPLSVSTQSLSVSIQNPQSTLDSLLRKPTSSFKVLDNVSFETAPGQIIAIMGASGSGKTTLLHSLAGRSEHANNDGEILFDGLDPTGFYENGSCCYVQQHDYLMPYLTVRETLRYTSELRLPSNLSRDDKYAIVESVINELGLKECANTIIGDEWKKGISGGEKRRVSVGCQLLSNPSILFLDEPTTGLDAYTAFNLIETLKKLSRKGRTVFITIHQPRSDIFELFDSVILLSKGKTVYAGAAGSSLLSYLKDLDYHCPEDTNPADYVIDIISIDDRTEEEEISSNARVAHLIKAWKDQVDANTAITFAYKVADDTASLQRSYARKRNELNDTAPTKGVFFLKAGKSKEVLIERKQPGTSGLGKTFIIARRAWRNLLRDNLSLWGSLTEVIIVGILFSFIFLRMDDNLSGVQSRKAALFVVGSSQPFLLVPFFIYKICEDTKIFDRERADRMYGSFPYIFGQFLAQLPFNVLFPICFSAITYFMMGFRTDELLIHFARYTLANVLIHFYVLEFSQLAVAIFRDFASASIVASAVYVVCSYSTGFFIQLDNIPIYLRWIHHGCANTFVYRLLVSNEFSNKEYACADVGIPCKGNNTLDLLSIDVDDYKWPIYGLLINIFTLLLLSMILLHFFKFDLHKHASAVKGSQKEENRRLTIDTNSLSRKNTNKVTVKLENIRLELETSSWNPFDKTVKRKVLLENISSEFTPGSLSIIMGASGTGKTTLLSVLCARGLNSSKFKRSGNLMFNGRNETDPNRIGSICSFVRQSDDHLLPALTCRETLVFAAKLRLPIEVSESRKIKRAEEVIRLLGLRDCADTIVGNENVKGLSGGERRRLSIGIQMLANPSVLVIDEPTSGLDSFTAHQIMETLKAIAESGRTIICSIHQPRYDIFGMFDSILLLARGGQVAYSGPATSIIPYFATQNLFLPKFSNPADFILDISSVDFRSIEAEKKSYAQLDSIVAHWKNNQLKNVDLSLNQSQSSSSLGTSTTKVPNLNVISPTKKTIQFTIGFNNIKDMKANNFELDDEGRSSISSSTKSSGTQQEDIELGVPLLEKEIIIRQMIPFHIAFPVLTYRSFVNTYRQPELIVNRILQIVILGVIQALYYFGLGNNQESVQNRIGALQQSTAGVFAGLLNTVAVFPTEKNLLFYEYSDRTYSVLPFFLAYMAIEIPIELGSSFVFAFFALYVVGLKTTILSFLSMALTSFCLVNFGESIGIAFCSAVDHFGLSTNLTSSVLGVFSIMTGLLSSNMPLILDRINRVSPVPYFAHLLAANEFTSKITFTCTDEQVLTQQCLYKNGTDVLKLLTASDDLFTFNENDITYYIVAGVGITIAYRFATFIFLKIRMTMV
ncbi:P-loop containing nucleoside triphosphate hydrolase protein [Globomyces pollinis-pini]|nr:P-loop containing nucleoside triphosphate hydrolase protein [Globomyces pollinis-pini]